MQSPDGYFSQTFTVEYAVEGSLDGTTISPGIRAPSRTTDPQQIHRPAAMENLGLINVDYVVSDEAPANLGSIGTRYVHEFFLDSPVAGAVGAALEIVDALSGTVVLQELIRDLEAQTLYFNTRGWIVPHGSLLRIRGFTNPGATPIRIRINSSLISDEGLLVIQSGSNAGGYVTPLPVPAPALGEWTLLRNKTIASGSDVDYVATQTLPPTTFEVSEGLSMLIVPRNVNGAIIAPTTLTLDIRMIDVATNENGDVYVGGGVSLVGAAAGEVLIENSGAGNFWLQLTNFVTAGACTSVDVWVRELNS